MAQPMKKSRTARDVVDSLTPAPAVAAPAVDAPAVAASHLFWQIRTVDLDDPEDCAAKFRSNAAYGAMVFASAVAGKAFA